MSRDGGRFLSDHLRPELQPHRDCRHDLVGDCDLRSLGERSSGGCFHAPNVPPNPFKCNTKPVDCIRPPAPPPSHAHNVPLAPAAEALVEDLLDLYRAAQTNIDDLIAAASDTSVRGRAYRSRLTGLSRAITETMADLDAAARGWTARSLPEVYALGAEGAARDIGERFNWTQIHREAVQQLATETFDDLLSATRYVRRDTKAFIRIAAREHTAAVFLEGKTATQAGRELARKLEQKGISAVTYKNGARHSIADYSDTILRSRSALSANLGTTNVAREHGIKYMICFDGPSCGLTSHEDPDLANGSVRTLAEAESYPTAHPRCARSWSPAPTETRQEAEAIASGDFSAVSSPPPTSGGSGHDRKLAQRQARLDARAAKVR